MLIPFYQSNSITGISIDLQRKHARIGILIVEPTEEETFEINGQKFYLLDDLRYQKQIKVSLENEYVAVSTEDETK